MKDLTRYAVRVIETGEVLDAGLREGDAEVYATTFNTLRGEREVEAVEIEWRIKAA